MLLILFSHLDQGIAENGYDILQGVVTVFRLVKNGQPMRPSNIRDSAQIALCLATSLYRQSGGRLNESGLNNGVKFLGHAGASIESAKAQMMEECRATRNGDPACPQIPKGLFFVVLGEVRVIFGFNKFKSLGKNIGGRFNSNSNITLTSVACYSRDNRTSRLNNGRVNNRVMLLFAHDVFLKLTKPNQKVRVTSSFVKAQRGASA
ncbi:hypothetical protein [Acetobacter orientalis]|uniref:hypothetical protein n=1 Tax=Acetobacter orientalis TaxID=146474 RepID=UPI0039EBF4B3